MQQILGYFWQICLFRAGPEKIPKSIPITAALLGIYFILDSIHIYFRSSLSLFEMLAAIIIGICIETAFLFGLLVFKTVSERFLSTLCGLLGSNSILLAILLPIHVVEIGMEAGLVADFLNALWIVCFFWWLAIVGFILHRAAEISIMQGTMLALMIELLVFATTSTFFSSSV